MTFIAAETPERAFRLGNFYNFNWGRERFFTWPITWWLFVGVNWNAPCFSCYRSFYSFLFSSFFFLHEENHSAQAKKVQQKKVWTMVPAKHLIISLFVTTFIIQLANMSIQPIITLYVKNLEGPGTAHIEMIAGAVMSRDRFSYYYGSSKLGRLSDQIVSKTLVVALFAAGIILSRKHL